MKRITKPDKWKDTWFLGLSPLNKLVFTYLYEMCDDAGFFDINFTRIANDIGAHEQEITASFNTLSKGFIADTNGFKIWIKNFLLHQEKIPLDLKTPEGNYIKYQLENNLKTFNNPPEFFSILNDVKKTGRSKSTTFIKPTVDEIVDNFKTGDWAFITREEIQDISDYYDSVGWIVGKKKMVDWNKAFIGCFKRNIKKFGRPNGSKVDPKAQTKIELLFEENKKLENFDYNSLNKR